MTSIDSAAAVDALATALVATRLAACVQIVPIRGVCHWQGEVRREAE